MSKKRRQSFRERNEQPYVVLPRKAELKEADFVPDWYRKCEVCGASPIMPATGMCGPCTTGESETAGGNW